MKINNIQTTSGYGLITQGAQVQVSYNDAVFMYHAMLALREKMQELAKEVYDMTENDGPRILIDEAGQILQSMDALLMPIATEIVVPKTEVNLFTYTTDTNKPDKEERKKKSMYSKGDAQREYPEAVPVQG